MAERSGGQASETDGKFQLAKIIVQLYDRERAICVAPDYRHPRPRAVRYEASTRTVKIEEKSVLNEYQKLNRRVLNVRDYGCSRLKNLAEAVPIFTRCNENSKWWLALSTPKLLKFLLTPVLSRLQSEGGEIDEARLGQCLRGITGFTLVELYKLRDVGTFTDLVTYIQQHFKPTLGGTLPFALPTSPHRLSGSRTGDPASNPLLTHSSLGEVHSGAASDFLSLTPWPKLGVVQPLVRQPLLMRGGAATVPRASQAKSTSVFSMLPGEPFYVPVQLPSVSQDQVTPKRIPPPTVPPAGLGKPLYIPGQSPRIPQVTPKYIVPTVPGAQFGESVPSTLEANVGSFPNPDVPSETFLPCHSVFRHDLPMPALSQAPDIVPTAGSRSKKLGKERVIERINATLDEIIKELSAQGKFVPSESVKKILDDILRSANQQKAYPDRVFHKEVTHWIDYDRSHSRVIELIKVFCWFSPITSLYELERAIADTENIPNFEALRMGPLLKHPTVCDLFRPAPSLTAIPVITMYKIHDYLMAFISRQPRGARKHDLKEFLDFVCQREGAESVNHLCIRISSFPLAIRTNFKFRRSQNEIKQRNEATLKAEMENILGHEVEKLKKQLTHSSDPLSIRRNLAKKEPVQILIEVFEAFSKSFLGMQQHRINDFLQCVTRDTRMRRLFLLALYEGAYGLPVDRLVAGEHLPQTQALTGVHSEVFNQPEGLVLAQVCEQLMQAPFPVDLASIARIEQNVADHFGAPTFHSLGHLSFVRFLADHSEAAKALGGGVIGGRASNTTHVHKALTLVSQLKPECREDVEVVAAALTAQFAVETVEDLGCGSVEKLLAQPHQVPAMTNIFYLSPLVSNGSQGASARGPTGGALGFQGREDALACLQRAPMLEDLGRWTQWKLVFEPSLGKLSDFLRKEESSLVQPLENDRVVALELSPDTLIRISPNSSMSDFVECLRSCDHIGTAGHLVSMAVQAGSVHGLPIQLLGSHVESALEVFSAESHLGESTDEIGDHGPESLASRFVFRCLIRIPVEICQYVAIGVFIEPLRKVVSSSAVDGLLSCCRSHEERFVLQSLGMLVGIKAWTDDFRSMVSEEEELHSKKLPSTSISTMETPTAYQEPMSLSSHSLPVGTAMGITEQEPQPEVGPGTLRQMPNLPCSEEEVAEREARCRGIIETIRREEFGEGIELDDRQQAVAARQRSREGRGLQRLSLELYSKDTHFVLELVQNADDNSYPETVVPSLAFVISDDRISILNNEVGFSEDNIRAICDVGRSTKGAHRSGYIGQKGIGFKSVFRVTDTPEVHSNEFHIKFDKGSDPIGFILPHWLDVRDKDHCIEKWTTRIVLPLKKDLQSSKMVRKFRDIQPSLLLFIHRLRNITVEDQVSGTVHRMERSDVGNGIVEIHHNSGQDRWLVVRKLLTDAQRYKTEVEATEIALAFPLPADFDSLTLAKDLPPQQVFAFLPLRSYGFRFIVQGDFDLPSSREDVNSDSAWNQWLREELPSLFVDAVGKMKELPQVSEIQAISLFLQFVPLEGELHDFFKPVSAHILHLLRGRRCLPSDPCNVKTEDDFLSVLSVPPEDSRETHCVWKQPSQLISVRDDFVRRRIHQALLESTLRLSYLNSLLLPAMNESLQSQLGIRSLNLQDLIAVATAVLNRYHAEASLDSYCDDDGTLDFDSDSEYSDLDPYTNNQTPSNGHGSSGSKSHAHQVLVSWIANWLACVQILMKESHAGLNSDVLNSLRRLPVIPLANGSLASADGPSLFFPTESGSGSEDRKFKEIFMEMQVVDPAVFEVEDGLTRSQVQKVLEQLGVRSLYPADIVRHHIIPQFKAWKDKTSKLLGTYLVYIKENIGQPGVSEVETIQLLKECVVIVTKNHGPKQLSKEIVHLSSEYKPAESDDLEAMFPDVRGKWMFVSPVYLQKSSLSRTTPAALAHSWRNLLCKLGVTMEMTVQAVEEQIQQGTPRWDELHGILKRSPDGAYTVRDYTCQEFKHIVNSVRDKTPEQQCRQMSKLAEYLDRHWDSKYRQFVTADYYDGSNKHHLGSISSSFKLSLVQLPWLPSKPTEPSPAFSEKTLYLGRELYDDTPGLHNLLSVHVPYIGAALKSANLVHELQIKSSVSAAEIIEFLQQWSQLCKRGTPFTASVQHMRKVYLYLKREWEQQQLEGTSAIGSSIQDNMQSKALLFVPDHVPPKDSRYKDTTLVSGHFYTIHQVCWRDQTTVLYRKLCNNESMPEDLVPRLLEPHYSSLQEGQNNIRQAFLSNPFGIDEEPKVSSLIVLLKYISSMSPAPDQKSVSDFTSIVLRLADVCRDQEPMRTFLHNNLKKVKLFPTQSNRWVALEDGLFENDDPELAKHFTDVEGVHFLRWPKQGLNRREVQGQEALRQEFLAICKIPKLSQVVATDVAPEGMAKPAEDLQWKLHQSTPLVQQFMATHHREHYQQLKERQVDEKLQNLKVISTEALYCQYSIICDSRHIYAPAVPSAQGCEFEDGESTTAIYVLQDKVEKPRSLVPALMKLFQMETQEFKGFLVELLLSDLSTDEEKMEIAAEHELNPLPDGDTVWFVSVPKRQPEEERQEEMTESSEDLSGESEDEQGTLAVPEEPELKSWPPRAPLRLDPIDKGRRMKGLKRPLAESDDVDRSAGVIGADEIQKVKQKHIPEVSTDPDHSTSLAPPLRQPQGTENSPMAKPHGKPGHNESKKPMPTAPETPREIDVTPRSNTRPLDKGSDSTQARVGDRFPSAHHAKPAKTYPTQQDTDVSHDALLEDGIVDVSAFMQKASLDGISLDLHPVPMVTEGDYESRQLVGKWGEQFVYSYLKQTGKLPDGREIREVEWVNEERETGKPYDLVVVVNDRSVYIEVKSTTSADTELVPISWPQLKFAEEKRESFYLFRVYNVGQGLPELRWLKDLHSFLKNKPVRIFLEL